MLARLSGLKGAYNPVHSRFWSGLFVAVPTPAWRSDIRSADITTPLSLAFFPGWPRKNPV